jgi:triosephosphate isomerase
MKIYAANWKLHKSPQQARDFFQEFLKQKIDTESKIVFFPTAICAEATAIELKNSPIEWGLQNAYCEEKGAFTGENSAAVLSELGGKWLLVGHSERRSLFFENDDLLAKKVKLAQDKGLTPMLCVGETLQQREAGKTTQVVQQQLAAGLKLASPLKSIVIAYEPVWAIGTGKVATVQQVREVHLQIKKDLTDLGFPKSIPVLYGGSVKADNAKELNAIDNVDGFLVGGASLEVKTFLDICRS